MTIPICEECGCELTPATSNEGEECCSTCGEYVLDQEWIDEYEETGKLSPLAPWYIAARLDAECADDEGDDE